MTDQQLDTRIKSEATTENVSPQKNPFKKQETSKINVIIIDSDKEEKDEFEESSLGNQIVGVIQNGQYLGPTRIMENGAPIYHVLNASNSGQKKLRMN